MRDGRLLPSHHYEEGSSQGWARLSTILVVGREEGSRVAIITVTLLIGTIRQGTHTTLSQHSRVHRRADPRHLLMVKHPC